tara:strand:- start:11341 stop:11820 length:480 start_codon:yes stop_codon:yes gene_type:complete
LVEIIKKRHNRFKEMKADLNTLLIIAGFVILIMFIHGGNSEPINKDVKQIETRIKDSIVFVDRIKKVVRVDKVYLDTLYINRYNTTDTVTIIKIQDTIIYKQKEVIIKQDTIINTQENITLAKDSIIFLKNKKIKKKNKDLFKITIIAIGAGAVAILKK